MSRNSGFPKTLLLDAENSSACNTQLIPAKKLPPLACNARLAPVLCSHPPQALSGHSLTPVMAMSLAGQGSGLSIFPGPWQQGLNPCLFSKLETRNKELSFVSTCCVTSGWVLNLQGQRRPAQLTHTPLIRSQKWPLETLSRSV